MFEFEYATQELQDQPKLLKREYSLSFEEIQGAEEKSLKDSATFIDDGSAYLMI